VGRTHGAHSGAIAVLGATAFGSLVGLAAGYYRGWIDLVITRISDIVLSFR